MRPIGAAHNVTVKTQVPPPLGLVERGHSYLKPGLGRCDMDMTKLQKLKECFWGKNDGTYINEVESLLFDKLQSAVGGCNTLNSGSLNQFHC